MDYERRAVIILPSKGEMQKQIEILQADVERYMQSAQTHHTDLIAAREDYKKQRDKHIKDIDRVNDSLLKVKKELDESKQQAADYKREIDKLADTKTVLDNLMSILKSPHNDYQKVVNELDDMLQQERSRANVLEQELRNIQFDIQRNQFLEGKVQAYEAMFRVKPIKAVQCEGEQQETA